MSRLLNVLVFFSLLFVGIAWGSISEHPVTQKIEILYAEFGLFNSPESGEPIFVRTLKVPLKENQKYGWVIVVRTNKPTVKWREELTLPSPPETWGEGEKKGLHIISSDRRTSITEREEEADHGLIINFWAIAPGDPKGRYIIRVTIEAGSELIFKFNVE